MAEDELRRRCDESTLQEDPRGFFGSLLRALQPRLVPSSEAARARGLRGEDFLKALASPDLLEELCIALPVAPVARGKCAQTAARLLLDAEAAAAAGADARVAALLAQVIVRAPEGATLQAALARRAAGPPQHAPSPSAGGRHDRLTGLSAMVSICEDAEQGRFAKAAAPVRAGVLLLREDPYAACLRPELWGSHCAHCFRRLQVPWVWPCPACAALAFCAEECRAQALASYHRWECAYSGLLAGSGMSVLGHVALRVLTQLDPADGAAAVAALRAAGPPGGPHAGLVALVTHEDQRSPRDCAARALMAFFLLRVLQAAGYLAPEPSGSLSEQALGAWALLFHALQALQYNAHIVQAEGARDAGAALYSAAALFNHDCCSPLARYFEGRRLALRTRRPLRPGEAVGDCYGPRHGAPAAGPGAAGRRRALRARYLFHCRCAACEADWPDLPELPAAPVRLRCPAAGCGGGLAGEACDRCSYAPPAAELEGCERAASVALQTLAALVAPGAGAGAAPLAAALDAWHAVALLPCATAIRAEALLERLMGGQLAK